MVRRHCLHQKRKEMQDKESSDAGGEGDDDDGPGDGSDPDEDADQLAARLAAGGAADDEDPNSGGRVEMLREPRPEPGSTEDAREADPDWARRNTEERVSAAGAAQPAKDRQAGSVADSRMAKGGEARFGVLFNPKGYNWTDTDDQCNVHWREHDRLEGLRKEWYGKASVGDGAVAVERDELDVWQKFAHDLVAQDRSSAKAPLRLLLLGTAGTGKSRTVRSFVGARRTRVRRQWDDQVWRARFSAQRREENRARQKRSVVVDRGAVGSANVLDLLGVSEAQASAAVAAAGRVSQRNAQAQGDERREPPRDAKEYWDVKEKMEEHVKNCCVLSAPTGCASFQLRFGAATLHRSFGVPARAYCGPWSKGQREGQRFRKLKARLMQAQLFVMDEMSMIGRQMMGKIEFRIRDTLKGTLPRSVEEVYLGGRDAVVAGDPKQAPPIADEPLCRVGEYAGRGLNKPAGSDTTPSNA